MAGRYEARLDDVQSEKQFRRLRPINATQHTALFFADAIGNRSAAIDESMSWSHSISVMLRGLGETNLLAVLRSKALDPAEKQIFGRSAIPADGVLRLLRIAAACTNEERFESLIFETFALASRCSMDDCRPGNLLRMQRLKRFIEQESHTDLTLERVARVAGLTTFACLRQFKEATGTTPHAYLLECRIKRARGLLCVERTSIAAVANASGFADQAHFARTFKKSTGLTPMQYRRAVTRT